MWPLAGKLIQNHLFLIQTMVSAKTKLFLNQPFLSVWVPSSFELRFPPAWRVKNMHRVSLIGKPSPTNESTTQTLKYHRQRNGESPLRTSYLKERHFSGLLDKQMELVDLLPHQRRYRITAGNDALRLSGQIKKNTRTRWKWWQRTWQNESKSSWEI